MGVRFTCPHFLSTGPTQSLARSPHLSLDERRLEAGRGSRDEGLSAEFVLVSSITYVDYVGT